MNGGIRLSVMKQLRVALSNLPPCTFTCCQHSNCARQKVEGGFAFRESTHPQKQVNLVAPIGFAFSLIEYEEGIGWRDWKTKDT